MTSLMLLCHLGSRNYLRLCSAVLITCADADSSKFALPPLMHGARCTVVYRARLDWKTSAQSKATTSDHCANHLNDIVEERNGTTTK